MRGLPMDTSPMSSPLPITSQEAQPMSTSPWGIIPMREPALLPALPEDSIASNVLR
jgi:hypothetical protein